MTTNPRARHTIDQWRTIREAFADRMETLLEAFLREPSRRHLLDAAAALRFLLIENGVSNANAFRMKIVFRARMLPRVETVAPPFAVMREHLSTKDRQTYLDQWTYWSQHVLDANMPDDPVVPQPIRELTLPQWMQHEVGHGNGRYYRVGELIKFFANKHGGVHVSGDGDGYLEMISHAATDIEIAGPMQQLRWIASTTYVALTPLLIELFPPEQ
ncbi:hypothetical protein AB0N73_09110 [Microbacterium sp. NPDC089189]|uniref:hypothetical protein n=1 Tax=Microbacterium sp. NPDC089189 TaxID=3154972 RepID=UPI0034486CE2